MSHRRDFGNVRKLPSGKFQANWRQLGSRQSAKTADGRPLTFDTHAKARAWLDGHRQLIVSGEWQRRQMRITSPATDPLTLRAYAEAWLTERELATTTRDLYRQLLRDHVYPAFGDIGVAALTSASVRAWHAGLSTTTGPTARAHAYGLLRTVLNTAVADDVIGANPCRVRGASSTKRVKRIRPASLPELEAIATAVPGKYQMLVLLAAWCALRFGELAELRRADVDVTAGVLRVRRGVVRTKAGRVAKGPKSEAGRRDVAIPPHLLPAVRDHLRIHAAAGPTGLLFPAGHGDQLAPSTLYKVYYPARAKAGREDLRFHDLRHTGAVLAAATGATLAELMARLGHSTPGAAMRYQHAAQDRDRAIANALSDLVKPVSGS